MNQLTGILIASFAIDRIANGIMFLLSFFKFYPNPETISDPTEAKAAAKKQTMMYYLFMTLLSFGIAFGFGEVAVFTKLGFIQNNPFLDKIFTAFLLMGGSESIGTFLKLPGLKVKEKQEEKPIEIKGVVKMEDTKVVPADANE